MSSVLAIVSKAVFEKQARGAEVGSVVAFDRYASTHAALAGLQGGGALFLVTVRPPPSARGAESDDDSTKEQLWLVGVLESPTKGKDGWSAPANVAPIVDIGARAKQLVFASGKGLVAKKGALGMSLQTPRALTEEDVAVLREAVGGKKAKVVKVTKPEVVAAKKMTKTGAGTGAKQVEAAINTKDSEAALRATLAWWTETRAPAVAELVGAISARVSAPAVTDETAFAALAGGKDPIDLGALLAAIGELPASFLPTAAELLAGFPDDPRHAIAVATWALDPITTSSSTYPFWTRSLDVLLRARDARVVPLLKKRLKKPQGDSKFWPKFYAALERALGKLGDAPADVAVPKALVERAGKLPPLAPRGAPARVVAEPAPKLDGPLLAQAQQHLAAGRLVAAIEAMVERWRADRVPALADLIDRATRLMPSWDLPLPPFGKGEADPWIELFERDAAGQLPRLLGSITTGDGRWGAAKLADRRLALLSTLPDDPRVASRLAARVTVWGISPERTAYWKSLLEQIARIRDPRTCEPLRVAFRDFTNRYFDHHKQAKRIVGPFVLDPPEVAPLPAADRALVDQLGRALDGLEAKSPERALIAAIAAAPDDDAPRLVYADWLGERQHPRGELIVLDCKRARSKPEDERRLELMESGAFGPLGELAELGTEQVDRGIPVRLPVHWGAGQLNWRAAANHPLVAAVQTIDVREVQQPPTADDLAAFVRAATRLRAIERVEEDPPKTLWAFADAALPQFRRAGGNLMRR